MITKPTTTKAKRFRKFALRILILLCIGAVIILCFIYHQHPILLKWVSCDAWRIGKPTTASVYTDGGINTGITVYRNRRFHNDYLIEVSKPDRDGMLKYINLDIDNKWVGRPVSTAKENYDVVNGSLYQDDVGSHFADFRDDIKGFNFDPHLYYSGDTIKFNIPPGYLKFKSVIIVLLPAR